MSLSDFLFDKPKPRKPQSRTKEDLPAATFSYSGMQVKADGISPEIVAVITASVYAMLGTANLAVKISHTGNQWAQVGRQKLMDSRQFA
ncbi:MAG TPA: hypothetical protein PKA28_12165 [Methylomusa anaerophila]|uniref:Uncharacterized protein n=1 Tax=Methylomusa anaerophila TaxID=1930071 RepID=A0A348AFC0_9FIRM|nr:hypothetical protein [Methylomusa anaerophila]BBB89768.1 hypothetical protein MAMMFC1_00402 [Methylomusa anaerophila]HML89186.1 hypothetical protein [Methylomusa anaerophila]